VSERLDFLQQFSTVGIYSAIHIGSHWKIETKHTSEKSKKQNNAKQNYLVQSTVTTLSQDTKWAFSTMLPDPTRGWHISLLQPVTKTEVVTSTWLNMDFSSEFSMLFYMRRFLWGLILFTKFGYQQSRNGGDM